MLGTTLNAAVDTVEAVVSTPFGRRIYLACTADAIVTSEFTTRAASRGRARTPLLREAIAQIEAYCGKRLCRFDVPMDLRGTPLQVEIWRIVACLEFGQTCSYGDVALAAGRPRAARGVAMAMARTPLALFIPAHRVVGADGRVKGATAGTLRRRLLAFEKRASHDICTPISAR